MDDFNNISEQTKDVMNAVLDGLTRAGAGNRTDPLFFPHGIELIRIDLEIGKSAVLSAKVVIAGEKGVAGASHLQSQSAEIPSYSRGEVPSELVFALGSVEQACAALWGTYYNDCSGFVKAVGNQLGININGNADSIVDQIRSGGDWVPLTDGVQAAQQASQNVLVVGGMKSNELKPPRANGHVVVVVPGPLAFKKYPTAWWGTLGGNGDHGKRETINWAFGSEDRDRVHYAYKQL